MFRVNKRLVTITILLSSLFFMSASTCAKTLLYANDPWPPWFTKHEEDGKTIYGGIDIEILTEVAKRLDLELIIDITPWRRSLEMMKEGKRDILASLNKTPEREKFMQYIEPAYTQVATQAFYVSKGNRNLIKRYEDLHHLDIGVVGGSKHFQRFDDDINITKQIAINESQLLRMLNKKRFDAFIGNEIVMDYLLKKSPFKHDIEKAIYKYDTPQNIYIALSKKSKLIGDIDDFNKVINDMINNGDIQAIVNKYLIPNEEK